MSRGNELRVGGVYALYSVFLGMAGAVFVIALADKSNWPIALFLLVAGLWPSWREWQRRDHEPAHQSQVVRKSPSSLRHICVHSLALWSRQIDTSRNAADDAVLRLTRLFGSTVNRLESTLKATQSAVTEMRSDSGSDTVSAIARSEAELHVVVEMLSSAQKSRNAILADVTSYARDLKDMVADVQKISLQVRLLSFNTAVEASRAGERGKGFAVVATEMRDLASLADATAGRMVKKVEVIDSTLENIFRDGESSARTEMETIDNAEALIHQVTDRFRQLTTTLSASLGIMEGEAKEVHREISDALETMQFQDRVSQIQAHVVGNLNALRETLEQKDVAVPDTEEWFRTMSRDFSTEEEFDNLRGDKSAGVAGRRDKRDVTFF